MGMKRYEKTSGISPPSRKFSGRRTRSSTLTKTSVTSVKKKTNNATDIVNSLIFSPQKPKHIKQFNFSELSPCPTSKEKGKPENGEGLSENNDVDFDDGNNLMESDNDTDESLSKSISKANLSVKDCLKQMFDGCDGCAPVYLSKPVIKCSTPTQKPSQFGRYSDIDSCIKISPVTEPLCLDVSSDYIRELPFYDVSKLPDLSFGIEDQGIVTPRLNSSIFTPAPLKQFTALSTPSEACSIGRFNSVHSPCNASFQEIYEKKIKSPVIPPEIKSNILSDVFCFVDVKTDNENCTEAVAAELTSMGAKVEKSLNKKVTHLIFKEGRPSVYKKAKRLGLAIVSVLWVEACKHERAQVDPSLFPPTAQEKYEELFSSGPKLPTLRTIQRKLRKHLLREGVVSSRQRKLQKRPLLRSAFSDTKEATRVKTTFQNCIKKLNFNSTISNKSTSNDLKEDVIVISSPEDLNFCNKNVKRNSAPSNFINNIKSNGHNQSGIVEVAGSKYLAIDKLFLNLNTKPTRNNFTDNSTETTGTSVPEDQHCKRRKLFDPCESPIIIDDNSSPQCPSAEAYLGHALATYSRSGVKTISARRKGKKYILKNKPAARRSLNKLLENEEISKSRDSLTLFVDSNKSNLKLSNKELSTIVCTSFTSEQIQKAGYIVGKLGGFDLEDKVSDKTTHLVSAGSRRTINLVKGIARGAWIVDIQWLLDSEKAGHWLNEEDFEMKSFSPAVVECRLERRAFGPKYCLELFSTCSSIYVSHKSVPPRSDLLELVKLCHGRICLSKSKANIIIGGDPQPGENIIRVKEKWILDSITNNVLLDLNTYRKICS